jgi:hypothetical protein
LIVNVVLAIVSEQQIIRFVSATALNLLNVNIRIELPSLELHGAVSSVVGGQEKQARLR